MIRNVKDDDLEALLAYNEAAVPHVNSIPIEELMWYKQHAVYFWVAEIESKVAGFLIVLAPGLQYDSENYIWFSEAYPSFAYVDRIVIAEFARGKGFGKALYQKLFEEAGSFTERVTCEVNTFPPNPESLSFHKVMGFKEVGQQETEGGTKTVSLQAKELN